MENKTCVKCSEEKEINFENFRVCKYRSGKTYFNTLCRICELKRSRKWKNENKDRDRQTRAIWRVNNPYYKKEYKIKNKEIINKKYREKRDTDPEFKLRKTVSGSISKALKTQNSRKNCSILEKLPYSKNELKIYIESLFEPWMTWQNWKPYNSKAWNDNDPSTWTWQLDHIIPQSDLPYNSMDHPNFKICWALENLRPYSAKLNILDGARRIRHK